MAAGAGARRRCSDAALGLRLRHCRPRRTRARAPDAPTTVAAWCRAQKRCGLRDRAGQPCRARHRGRLPVVARPQRRDTEMGVSSPSLRTTRPESQLAPPSGTQRSRHRLVRRDRRGRLCCAQRPTRSLGCDSGTQALPPRLRLGQLLQVDDVVAGISSLTQPRTSRWRGSHSALDRVSESDSEPELDPKFKTACDLSRGFKFKLRGRPIRARQIRLCMRLHLWSPPPTSTQAVYTAAPLQVLPFSIESFRSHLPCRNGSAQTEQSSRAYPRE